MHRTGKHHPRPAQQHGFQPLGRQTRRFIDHDHFRLRPLRQQFLWRQKAKFVTGPGGQLGRRIQCQSITQCLPGVSEQGSHVISRRCRYQHPFAAGFEQAGSSHAKGRRFASAAIGSNHQRPSAAALASAHYVGNQRLLLGRLPGLKARPARLRPVKIRHAGIFRHKSNDIGIFGQYRRQPGSKGMSTRPIQPGSAIVRVIKIRPLRQRRHQPEQQPTRPQGAGQCRKGVWRRSLPAIPDQNWQLLPQYAPVIFDTDMAKPGHDRILFTTDP